MTQKCDCLKTLAVLTTMFERHYMEFGCLEYNDVRQIIQNLMHGIQMNDDTTVNDLKRELDVYHND